jgi:hypothetical protein
MQSAIAIEVGRIYGNSAFEWIFDTDQRGGYMPPMAKGILEGAAVPFGVGEASRPATERTILAVGEGTGR